MSMSVSLQKSSTKTNLKHNNRTMSEKEKERNPHIDESRSSENKYLVQKDLKELYEQEFGGALEKYNAKQKRHDRKIKNYYNHIDSSKKTSVQQEMIIQVGDKDDFLNPENKKIANEILENWFEDFEKRNPNLKVYNAVIHNDEASPHLHLNFVPVAGDYKNGLEKQVSFDKAIIQQDSTMKKERPFDQWREKEVSLLEEKLNEHGIERKLVGKNNYKDVNEYKEKKDLEKEIQLLEKNIANKKEELLSVIEDVPNEIKIPVRKQMKNVEVASKEKNIFGVAKKEIKKVPTGKLIVNEDDFKKTMSAAQDNERLKNNLKKLLSTDFVQENKILTEAVDSNFEAMKFAQTRAHNLLIENKELLSENRNLKSTVADLKSEIGSIYQSAKDFIEEHTKDLQMFKHAFKNLVDKVRKRTPESEFERSYKRENTFSMESVQEMNKTLGKSSKQRQRGRDRGHGMDER